MELYIYYKYIRCFHYKTVEFLEITVIIKKIEDVTPVGGSIQNFGRQRS